VNATVEPSIRRKETTVAKPSRREVVPSKTGTGWDVKGGQKNTHHQTQANAEKAAKQDLRRKSGGEVVIHGRDGRIRDKDTVPPAKDPNPPKDKRH
jgi:hypothetical protein